MNTSPALPPPAAWYSGAVDRRLRPRRPLAQVALAGARLAWHRGLRWIITGMAALAALMAATEPHRVCDSWGSCDAEDWGASHTLAADLGATPFILLAMVIALQLAGRRSTFATRMLTALVSLVFAFFVLGGMAFAHLLSNVDGGGGAVFAALCTTGLCLFQTVLEPVLAIGQRRALEATEPSFPRAAVV